MPLPDSTCLSLQVNSNAVQSKPKRAMIVRMSAETLDALEAFPNNPSLSFDFGDIPGIHIGNAFFPMRPQKESSPHELYLRAASAAKPMAPLKLYASVIGKFMVERQLGNKVTDKVRHQTMVAKQEHMERRAILLDKPPIPVSGSKHAKRKIPGSGTVVLNKTPASEHLRVASPSTASPRKVSPLPQNTRANVDVRRRLVHCLAISPRLSDEAVKMVGGAKPSTSARDELLALLQDVAEQRAPQRRGDITPRPWSLKPQTWTEVRPFDWPKLTEPERVAMARQARIVFQALKIPESDPVWDNVRYRSTTSTVPTAAQSAAKTIASRRLPGSGYQAKKSPQSSTSAAERPGTPVDPRPAPKPSLPPSLPQKPSPTAPPPSRIPDREREREKRERAKEKQRQEWEKDQERAEVEKRERARQKERETIEREKRRREKQRERQEISNDASSKPPLPKRRKLDDGSSLPKARDAPLPKKPVHEPSPVPRLKTKKDVPSTAHASAPSQDRHAASGPTHKPERPSKHSASTKPRRRSPIYTSSSDEGEIPQPRKRNPSPPSVSDRSISDQPPTERAPRQQRSTRMAYPPPTDHAALRALYQSQYSTYLGTFSKIVAQKRKIEAILNGDSEAEVDVMDPDDLMKLSNEHKSLKTELKNIHEIYTKGSAAAVLAGGGSTS
ncbi:hypothetical protein EV363DRAFT_1323555, partial [Boletus edulis]